MSKKVGPIHPLARNSLILAVLALFFTFFMLMMRMMYEINIMQQGLVAIIPHAIGAVLGVIAFVFGIIALIKIKRLTSESAKTPRGRAHARLAMVTGGISMIVGAGIILIIIAFHSVKEIESESKFESPPVQGKVSEYFYSDPEYNLGPKSTVILPDTTCLTLVKVVNRKDNPREYSDDYYLLKTDISGNEIKRVKFDKQSHAMVYLPEKGIFITASKEMRGSAKQLLHYSIDCELIGSYQIEGFQQNRFMSFNLIPTRDGNLFLTGIFSIKSVSFNEGEKWFITALKVSPDGKTIWQEDLFVSDNEYGNLIAETNDGGYLISRHIKMRNPESESDRHYPPRYLRLIKLSQNGSLEWEVDITDSIAFEARDIKVSDDESIVLLGIDSSSDSTGGRSALCKFDKHGNHILSEICQPVIRNMKVMKSEIEMPYYPDLYGIVPWQEGKWMMCGRLLIGDAFVMPSALGAKDLKWFISILDEDFNRTAYFFGEENTVAPLFITPISPGHGVITCVGDRKEDSALKANSETLIGGSVVLLHYMDK